MAANERSGQAFGLEAERYDRTRPSYPPELVDDLMAAGPRLVLDVGCGTGKAARLFADRGCAVTGVEPDERMAALARRHGLDVDVSTFEAWEPAGRTFDLVTSAQAWHWVDRIEGPRKARRVLRPGGAVAIFANILEHDRATEAAFAELYVRLAPGLGRPGSRALGPDLGDATPFADALVAAGGFVAPEHRTYDWSCRYTTAEWLDLLPSHGDHMLLPPERLRALLNAVGDAIERAGGSIDVRYTTHLITARAREGAT